MPLVERILFSALLHRLLGSCIKTNTLREYVSKEDIFGMKKNNKSIQNFKKLLILVLFKGLKHFY